MYAKYTKEKPRRFHVHYETRHALSHRSLGAWKPSVGPNFVPSRVLRTPICSDFSGFLYNLNELLTADRTVPFELDMLLEAALAANDQFPGG
jgi:hypothetical protein